METAVPVVLETSVDGGLTKSQNCWTRSGQDLTSLRGNPCLGAGSADGADGFLRVRSSLKAGWGKTGDTERFRRHLLSPDPAQAR